MSATEALSLSHSPPPPFFRPLGAGVLRKFGADFFCVFFFWFPSSGNPECAKVFLQCAKRFFTQILGAQISAQIFGAQIFLRRFGS